MKNRTNGGVDRTTLLDACIEVLIVVLTRISGMKELLEATRPLGDYGVDSLVAVETELSVEFSVLDIVGARTPTALSTAVLKKLKASILEDENVYF